MSHSDKEPVASCYISCFDEALNEELVASHYMSRFDMTSDKEKETSRYMSFPVVTKIIN